MWVAGDGTHPPLTITRIDTLLARQGCVAAISDVAPIRHRALNVQITRWMCGVVRCTIPWLLDLVDRCAGPRYGRMRQRRKCPDRKAPVPSRAAGAVKRM